VRVGGREIAAGLDPFIIAEIGVNHDGDEARALELVDAAAEAGADAVKVQLFRASLLLGAGSGLAAYQKNAGETDARAMLERLELGADAMRAVVGRARERGVAAVCTVFTPELVDEAVSLGFDAFKTASPDLVNRPLIERLLPTGAPLILSTGAAEADEVAASVGWIGGARERAGIMHCVSAYPTPEGEASLGAVRTLAAATGLPAGYSDHTEGEDTGALAVCAGACLLEKHLTYSRAARGPDHAASLEPDGFAAYVRLARRARVMLGDGAKRAAAIEGDVRRLSRQSLAAVRAIGAGEVIVRDAVTTRRPGTGLCAAAPEVVIGKRAARAIEAGALLSLEDVS